MRGTDASTWLIGHCRAAAVAIALCVWGTAAVAQAANPIQIENAKPGDWDWYLDGAVARNGEIEGYANQPSYQPGWTVNFMISTTAPQYKLTIYRVGWYGGVGGRRMTDPVIRNGVKQRTPTPDPETGLVDANWELSYRFVIPSDWTSGYYLAKLETIPDGLQQYIVFVVRNDSYPSTYLVQSPVNTWQAYNAWGGKSLYGWNSTDGVPAYKVSICRPYADGDGSGYLFAWEIHMVRFLEREGYDVTYGTNYELDDYNNASLITPHKALLSIGHDEYWTHKLRKNVELAREKGVNLAFFGSNSVYWQIRYEPSPYRNLPRRTIVAYKYDALTKDPYALDGDTTNDKYITTTWRSAPLNRPEDALVGTMYHGDPADGDVVVSNAAHWIYAGTGAKNGDRLKGLLGYETDAATATAPEGLQIVAHSPDPWGFSDMTVYTWPASNATVFATGTLQFAWGLDNWWQGLESPVAQQMTRNVLARFAATNTP
jgi:hypothetical protein